MDNFLDSATVKGRKFKERLRGERGKQELPTLTDWFYLSLGCFNISGSTSDTVSAFHFGTASGSQVSSLAFFIICPRCRPCLPSGS